MVCGGGIDCPQPRGRGSGGGQRGVVAAWRGKTRSGAGDGVGEGEIDHAADAVRERGVRADEGGGGAAHAVFQGVPAAVLPADDGRDGGVGAAGGGGGGGGGGEPEEDDAGDEAARDDAARR